MKHTFLKTLFAVSPFAVIVEALAHPSITPHVHPHTHGHEYNSALYVIAGLALISVGAYLAVKSFKTRKAKS